MKKTVWGVVGVGVLTGLVVLSGCGILKPARHEEIQGQGGYLPPLQAIEKDDFAAEATRLRSLIPENAPGDFSQPVHQFATEGLRLHTTKIFNPAGRSIKVWLSAESSEPAMAHFYVGQQTYHQDPWFPVGPNASKLTVPTANPIQWHFASGRLRVGSVRIRFQSPKDAVRAELKPQQWVNFDLGSQESAEVDWLSARSEDQSICDLPPAIPHPVTWWDGEIPSNLGRLGDPADLSWLKQHQGQLTEPWVVGGYEAVGNWTEKWSESEQWETAPGPLHSEARQFSISDGNESAVSQEALRSPYTSCQGLF